MPNTNGQRRVDNILKMLLGVLSVAGLIAVIIPEQNPLPDNVVESTAEVSAPPPSESRPLPPPAPLPVQFDSEPVSDFQIGAPTIDGNPMQPEFGLPFGTSPQTNSSNPDDGQSSQAGYTPPSYALPGSESQPVSGEQDTVIADRGE